MARNGTERVHKKPPVDAILAGAARLRALRRKLREEIDGLTPSQLAEYKQRAEALPPKETYF